MDYRAFIESLVPIAQVLCTIMNVVCGLLIIWAVVSLTYEFALKYVDRYNRKHGKHTYRSTTYRRNRRGR